jgi:hypothetical protein
MGHTCFQPFNDGVSAEAAVWWGERKSFGILITYKRLVEHEWQSGGVDIFSMISWTSQSQSCHADWDNIRAST